jgi:hypothetical protein
MKTPEEMAEEYTRGWWGSLPEAEGMRKSARENFLAGYKTGQEEMLEYARHVSSSGQMTILSPIPNDKRNFCRKGVVVMFEDLKRYTDSLQE